MLCQFVAYISLMCCVMCTSVINLDFIYVLLSVMELWCAPTYQEERGTVPVVGWLSHVVE